MERSDKRPISISLTLAGTISAVVGLAVGVVFWIQWGTAQITTEELILARTTLLSARILEHIAQLLEPAASQADFLAARIKSRDIDVADDEALSAALANAMAGTPQVSAIAFFDETNRFVGARRGPDGLARVFTEDRSDEPVIVAEIQATLSAPDAFWGHVVLGPDGVVVNRRKPIRVGDITLGAVVVTVSISELSAVMEAFGKSIDGTGFILYGDQHVLAHPSVSTLHEDQSAADPLVRLARVADPVLRGLSTQMADDPVVMANNVERHPVDVDGTTTVAFIRWTEAYGAIPWGVGVWAAAPRIDIAKRRLARSGYVGIAAFFLALLSATLVGRAVARPIKRVTAGAVKIGRFDLDDIAPLASSRIRELNDQAIAFNTALDGLRAFGKYVPKELVQGILSSEFSPEPGGERRPVTILFTDIQDFTTLSEKLSPEQLLKMLSAYFGRMVSDVLGHDGTVDKFVGDAIMAYWNAPRTQEDHIGHACHTALSLASISNDLNAAWKAEGSQTLYTRIGVHTGDCVVGHVGSEQRVDFTVFGAPVNMASRLEGLNKHYGTQILVSDDVRRGCGGRFVFRSVDLVLPKGAVNPLSIFELVGRTGASDLAARCASWEAAYAKYVERDWGGLAEALEVYLQFYPVDTLVAVYQGRAKRFLTAPPNREWNGAEEFTSK